MAHGQHTAHIVVYGTGENAAEDDPQIAGRAEFGAHDGAEDGTRSRNVQELDHIHLPGGHDDEIHSIGFGDSRRGPFGIRSEHPIHKSTVQNIAQNQGDNADDKTKHYSKKLKWTRP